MIRILLLTGLLLSALHSQSYAREPLVFKRDILTIVPKPEPVVKTDKKEAEKKEEAEDEEPSPPREPIRFYTEIRSQQALELDWVHSLTRINSERTMTVVFDPERYDVIRAQPIYEPLDILSISPEGVIVQIVPNLVLSKLTTPIESEQPIKARLILMGGAADTLGIMPGDRVEHALFTPNPKVLVE